MFRKMIFISDGWCFALIQGYCAGLDSDVASDDADEPDDEDEEDVSEEEEEEEDQKKAPKQGQKSAFADAEDFAHLLDSDWNIIPLVRWNLA